MIETEIALSVISLLPDSFGADGLVRAGAIARRLGVSLQLNPLRSYRAPELSALKANGVNVLSVEYGAWAPTLKAFVSKTARGDIGALCSPIIFGCDNGERAYADITSVFPNAIEIDHPEWETGRVALETAPLDHPHLSEHDYYRAKAVVFDTWHCREAPGVIADPEAFAHTLLKQGTIALIHAQTRDREELDDFCRGEETRLERLLRIVLPSGVPVVIELHPLHVWRNFALIQRVRSRIEEIGFQNARAA